MEDAFHVIDGEGRVEDEEFVKQAQQDVSQSDLQKVQSTPSLPLPQSQPQTKPESALASESTVVAAMTPAGDADVFEAYAHLLQNHVRVLEAQDPATERDTTHDKSCNCQFCSPIDAWTAVFGSAEQIFEKSIPDSFRRAEGHSRVMMFLQKLMHSQRVSMDFSLSPAKKKALETFFTAVQHAIAQHSTVDRVRMLCESRWRVLGALYDMPSCCVEYYVRKKFANLHHAFSISRCKNRSWFMCDACYVVHMAETRARIVETAKEAGTGLACASEGSSCARASEGSSSSALWSKLHFDMGPFGLGLIAAAITLTTVSILRTK